MRYVHYAKTLGRTRPQPVQPHPGLLPRHVLSVSWKASPGIWTPGTRCSGPLGQEGEALRPHLWLCDLPPWDICLLPTICASEFPGGCSPAAGEWLDRTRLGKPNLWGHRRVQHTGHERPRTHHAAPFPRKPPCPSAHLTAGGRGQMWLGSPQGHGCLLCTF